VSSGVVITIVFGILASNVAMMGVVVKVLGDRITDVVGRMDRIENRADRIENRADERHNVVVAKLDGIAETLARFDERIKTVERRT
jgi:hypothetical protein